MFVTIVVTDLSSPLSRGPEQQPDSTGSVEHGYDTATSTGRGFGQSWPIYYIYTPPFFSYVFLFTQSLERLYPDISSFRNPYLRWHEQRSF